MEKGIQLEDNELCSVDSLILLASNKLHEGNYFDDYQDYNMPQSRNPDNSSLFKNLRKAALVCESMSNTDVKKELKVLIEESINLFREYQLADAFDRKRSAIAIPSSPTSSMLPQLGQTEKFSIVIPQLDRHHRILELSLLTPTSDSSEKSNGRHYCLNLKRINFKPLRRLGGKLSRMIQNIRRYGTFKDLRSTIRAMTPTGLGPLSSPLPPYRPTSPSVAIDVNDNVCRSTEVDFGSSITSRPRVDQVSFRTSKKLKSTDDIDSYPDDDGRNKDMQLEKRNQIRTKHPSNSQSYSLPHPLTAVTAKKLLLLETATAIGLSLCKAFLIWKHVASCYWHEQAMLSPAFSEVPIIKSHLVCESAILTLSKAYSSSSSSSNYLTIAVSPPDTVNHTCGNSYHCDTSSSNSYDSYSHSDVDVVSSLSKYRDEGVSRNGIRNNRRKNGRLDTSSIDDTTRTDPNINYECSPRSTASNQQVSVQGSSRSTRIARAQNGGEGHPNKNCSGEDNLYPTVVESKTCHSIQHSRYHGISPEGEITSVLPNKWLGCLNDIDTTDCADKDQDEDSSGSSCRFEYEEVFGPNGPNSSQKGVQRSLYAGAPTDISDSDSEADFDIASCSTANTHCLRTSPTSFIESNPLSKLLVADKQGRSATFDGGCLPLPLLFERKKKLQTTAASRQQFRPQDDLNRSNTKIQSPEYLPSSPVSTEKILDAILTPAEPGGTISFLGTSDYKKYTSFMKDSRGGAKSINATRLIAKTSTVGFPGGADYKDCFGSPREPLLLQSPIAARNDQYRAIGPVVRSNELAMWAIFAQYPMVCDATVEHSSSALTVHNYSGSKPLLSFAALRSLLSAFGVCPAICSETELLEHLKEMKVATSPPSSPFFIASPIKVCSFESFVKILWLVASERMLISINAVADQSSDIQAQVRFAMLLHQMDISDGRSKLTQHLMNNSNQNQNQRYTSTSECLSPQSPVSQTYMEPLLPLPPFDLSVLRKARAVTGSKRMTVHDANPRVKGRKKVILKGSSVGALNSACAAAPNRTPSAVNPSLWSKFTREVTSGIATDHSSEDLSDF